MNARQRSALATAIVLCSINSGCTLVGLGIGSAIDSGNKRIVAPEQLEAESIQLRRNVKVDLRAGERASGPYAGLVAVPQEEYAARYAAARAGLGDRVKLPALGESVTITTASGNEFSGGFSGFDYDRVALRLPGEFVATGFPLDRVAEISDGNGTTLEGTSAASLVSQGQVPLLSALALYGTGYNGAERGSQLLIPLEDVRSVQISTSTGKTIGALAGAAVDLAVVAAAAIAGGFIINP